MPYTTGRSSMQSRFGLTLALAVLLHFFLIVGLEFLPEAPPKPASKSLDIALTITRSTKPKDADFIAQENQQGSGSEVEKSPPRTVDPQQVPQPKVQPIARTAPPVPPKPQTPKPVVTTKAPKPEKVPVRAEPEKARPEEPRLPPTRVFDSSMLSSEIANLEAELAQDMERYAKRPRVHRLHGVSSMRDVSAWYREEWRKKVERVGNLNYPQEAKKQQIHGSLRLLVVIARDGSVVDLQVLESSGYPVLDNAALRIVRLSAPFAPFTGELARTYDQIEIIRTWRFERGDRFVNQ